MKHDAARVLRHFALYFGEEREAPRPSGSFVDPPSGRLPRFNRLLEGAAHTGRAAVVQVLARRERRHEARS